VQFVLSNPLCFLTNKFGKEQVKLLKSALIDFYSVDELISAKQQLLKDVDKVNAGISLPHIPQQRQGENRGLRSVDDMIAILTVLDEHKSLATLPAYVADGPDKMPSLRLYEGDFGILLSMLRKMSDQLAMNGSAITALARDVNMLQAAVRPPESCSGPPVPARRPQPQQSIQPQPHTSTVSVNNHAGQSVNRSAEPTDGYITSGNSDSLSVMHNNNNNCNSKQCTDSLDAISGPRTQWSAVMSTPVIHENRFSALTTDDEQNNDGERFTEQRSARVARAKRRRRQSNQQRSAADSDNEPQHETSTQPRRRPVMTGKARATSTSLAAARKYMKKSVFCVDNVSMCYSAEDIKSFVSSMAIDVVSCFEVKPRRRRSDNDDDAINRKAFRLCINAADRQRLLDPAKWPDSVMVFEWFFKTTNIDDRQAAIGKRQCLDEPTTVDATLTSDQRQQTDMDLSSNDDTILTGSTSTSLVNTDTQDG